MISICILQITTRKQISTAAQSILVASLYCNITSCYRITTSKAANILISNYLLACLCVYIHVYMYNVTGNKCSSNPSQKRGQSKSPWVSDLHHGAWSKPGIPGEGPLCRGSVVRNRGCTQAFLRERGSLLGKK